jgi:8-oxo-dGTP pyrophosphatase MutT (NUDIX family)
MRQSQAAIAVIRQEQEGRSLWLAQWNPNWGAFHFVSGHRRPEESFRECVVREIEEELELREGDHYRVVTAKPIHLDYVDFSLRAQTETRYIMELFNVELRPSAGPLVEANSDNLWLSVPEIHAGRTSDGRPVSATMKRLLDAIVSGITA